jgi:LPS sulfotransferase NodH
MKDNFFKNLNKKILNNSIYRVFGKTNYKKFIIITRSRTGSNLLISLLDSHPNVEANEELFNRIHGRSCKSIWNEVFCKKPKRIKQVGFKIFYYHPLDSSDRSVWDYIKNDKSIYIIHLKRHNLLRTLISKKIAEKTNNWSQTSSHNRSNTPPKLIMFDKDEFFEDFETTKKWETETDIEFSNHKILSVVYEDLISDIKGSMNNMQNYLDLETFELTTKLKRQNPEKLKDLVQNYDIMIREISKSKWSYLLDNE